VYSSAEGEEVVAIDDNIFVDVGQAYTCKYGTTGLNVTMAVLGPYDAADEVAVIVRTATGKTLVPATYRRARDAYYNYYGVFISDIEAMGLISYGVQVTRADGTVSVDTQDDVYYKTSTLSKCLADAPIPSGITRRAQRKVCADGLISCDGRCINPFTDIENCGGCSYTDGVDCTSIYDGAIACVQGKCVRQD
jgi:hypothetical protein